MIRSTQLIFGYNDNLILRGINLTIPRGDFVGIIGPNGSGKSTLLGLLSGVLQPTDGAIYVKEQTIHMMRPRELAKTMAVVPQSTELAYDFTAYEIVAMGRYPHQGRWSQESSKDREVIRLAMEETGIWHLRDQMVTHMSGGERQRVIIARALAQEPEVILLDEPTSNLDINYQIEIFDLLRELNRQGKTIVVVSHDLNLASLYCEHLLLLSEGRVFAFGTPDEVLTVKHIRQVYNTEVVISRKYSGRPYVTLISRSRRNEVRTDLPQVHLICGGGSGQEVLNWLLEEGYPVSGGVLNQGDSDWQTLVQNDRPVVEERPFSAILSETYDELLAMMTNADVVIVADLPFGPGNLSNLEAVLVTMERGKTVLLLEKNPIQERDFTGGRARMIYEELVARKAVVCRGVDELAAALERCTLK